MKKFLCDDFLLSTDTAKELYHVYAKNMPIIDYHCHISPKEIAEDKQFRSITELFLGGDHYKWRQLRAFGVSEELITGKSDDREKFRAFARLMPKLIGNPIYHWTHLELARYFGVTAPLTEKNADEIFDACNKVITDKALSPRKIIKQSCVRVICTTDDPIDTLEWHRMIKADNSFDVKVLPAYRPDKAVTIDKDGFAAYIGKLSEVSGISIDSMDALYKALSQRLDFFTENGCLVSDHALDAPVFESAEPSELDAILAKALSGNAVGESESNKYKTALLLFFGKEYSKRNIVMQLHIGAVRNNCTRLYKALGPDVGCDSAYNPTDIRPLSKLLDALDTEDSLPKTILYSLNIADDLALASLMGAFQRDIKGKLQLGSAWWFNDTKNGMIKQLTDLSELGVLGLFVGMLTDSRSFLSYTRHEYFRRILCEYMGGLVENGEYPYDIEALGTMICDISYNNAKHYFGF